MPLKHGMRKTKTYETWRKMKARCLNPKSDRFPYYGARGIKIDLRWVAFEEFFKDMGERPEGTTLDRINNDGNYTKENCQWATKKEQAQNRRSNVLVTIDGETKCVSYFSEKFGLNQKTVQMRIRNGMPESEWFKPIKTRIKECI